MNFEFSDEQNLLREQARGFLEENCSPKVVRSILEGDHSYDYSLWKNIIEMGWTSTVIPEEYGGLGLSYLELSVISEELGRVYAPVPFSSTVYLLTEAILVAGTKSQKNYWLPKIAEGQIIGCFAVSESEGQPIETSINLKFEDGNLTGTKLLVADGDIANLAVVFARGKVGVSAYLVDLREEGVTKQRVNTIDPTRSHAKIRFHKVSGELLGEEGRGWELLEEIYNRAAVLFAWEQVGGSDTALYMATEYAKTRFAFGRPIGSYQAIKHKLAYAYVKNTLARGNCYYGSWALSNNAASLPLAAAAARVSATQAYYYASKENIQTHGGMGFTWEFDCQFGYRRSKLLAVNLGSEYWWKDKLISAIENESAQQEVRNGF